MKLNIETTECIKEKYYFLVNETTFVSDDLHFRKNLTEQFWKIIKTIDERIRVEKIQYDLQKEAIKVSALSSVLVILTKINNL